MASKGMESGRQQTRLGVEIDEINIGPACPMLKFSGWVTHYTYIVQPFPIVSTKKTIHTFLTIPTPYITSSISTSDASISTSGICIGGPNHGRSNLWAPRPAADLTHRAIPPVRFARVTCLTLWAFRRLHSGNLADGGMAFSLYESAGRKIH